MICLPRPVSSRARSHQRLNERQNAKAFFAENLYVRYGQRWRVGNRTNEARKRHENHGDCGSPWVPLSVSTHAANHHEVRLVQLCFDFYMIEAKPENLIGDRAYDSDPLDEELRNDG